MKSLKSSVNNLYSYVCLVHGYILFLKLRHMCDGLDPVLYCTHTMRPDHSIIAHDIGFNVIHIYRI